MKSHHSAPMLDVLGWRKAADSGKVCALERHEVGVFRTLDDGSVSFIASTATPDRYGDTIEQAGWNLSAYQKNPVLLWAHSHSEPPVGRVVSMSVKDGNLVADRVEFTTDEVNPFGAKVGRMVKAGFLNAVSVGFLPSKFEPRKSSDGSFTGYNFQEQELLELSVVPVPANPEALLQNKAFAAELRSWVDAKRDVATDAEARDLSKLQTFLRAAGTIERAPGDMGEAPADVADAVLLVAVIELLGRIAVAAEGIQAALESEEPVESPGPVEPVEPMSLAAESKALPKFSVESLAAALKRTLG